MKTPKLITNYSGLSDTDLASLATRTVDALQTNANFPDLNPPFAEYEPVALDYVAKQAITANGRASGKQKEEKDEAREALLVMMRRTTSYINNFTQISSVQLSSGFYPVQDRKSGREPDAPSWTHIRQSNRPAEILLGFEPIRAAYQYEMQIATELDEQGQPLWQSLPLVSDSRRNYYAPVEDGVRYHFRVRATNRHGVSAWSPVATRKAWVD
ncbi:fibronectin type III domain-containing protein [Parapedobacter sp. 10938]|uniref:fibronectin type III domain-containing protein n=1 Tax=Parapedobacter flavus TaxID=3110225 RepID=UPI002DB8C625|nr:fibronectin type III domain-containing protein [Parapedobacter sp. 10938]MEC3880600.1 fibronectin type III domain-containing protein [Parapedobacter sp. 10938]